MRKRKTMIGFLLILFVIIAYMVNTGKTAAVDQMVYQQVALLIDPFLTRVMIIISWLGDTHFIVSFILLLLLISKFRYKAGLPMAIAGGTAATLNSLLKQLFSRTRPGVLPLVIETSYSFPSGHSMSNMAIYTVLSLVLLSYKKSQAMWLWISFLYGFVILIGFSRIYLGVHYFSDVIGGYLGGLCTAFAIYPVIQKILDRDDKCKP